MTKMRFICRKCGHKFAVDVFEKGEAEAKKLPAYPIICPECRSGDLEQY